MRSIIKKLTWTHILLIGALPILLALINPNWIFNVGISDDYIYLGYQLNFPKYIGWEPSSTHYFIERMSWTLPTYIIRQLFSPLMGNFVVHLGVYYLAIFSIYGTLNRLFNARVALLTCLLMGQFSLFLRATGWDYVDGYTLALFALCIYWLTEATQSPRYRRYLMGAGMVVMLMVNAQFFSLFYTPALAAYYLLLNHYRVRRHIIRPIIWSGLGLGIVFGLLTLIYYQLTGNWFIFANTLLTSQNVVAPQGWRDLINTHPAGVGGMPLALFFSGVGIMAIWFMVRQMQLKVQSSIYQHQQALILLFTGSLAVFAFWALMGYYGYMRLTFYTSLLLPSAFLLIGATLIIRFEQVSSRSVTIIYAIILISFGVFMTIMPMDMLTITWLAIIAMCLFIFSLIIPPNRAILLITTTICLFSFIGGTDQLAISIYVSDRYALQNRYEIAMQAATIIDDRYETYSLENFRFLFPTGSDLTRRQKRNTILSLYLMGWGRYLTPFDAQAPVLDANLLTTNEIILLISPEEANSLLLDINQFLSTHQLELTLIEEYAIPNSLIMAFTKVFPIPFIQNGRFVYHFNIQIESEIGFDTLQSVNNRSYRWTNAPTASLRFAVNDGEFDPNKTYQVQFWTFTPLEAEVQDSLRVSINGQELILERIPQGADTLFQAEIEGAILNRDVLELVFETDRISRPADFGYPDQRTLGVALDWLTIELIEK